MSKYRMFPPTGVTATESPIPGKWFDAGAALFLDVAKTDAQYLAGAGWACLAFSKGAIEHGVTADRPASPRVGQFYGDSTLAIVVYWDGAAWRNAVTGAEPD